jgi:excisionase family DNA binding protein
MPNGHDDHARQATLNTQHAWPEVMLASEVSEYLRVSYATVIKMTKAGDIPALAIGREFRYLRSEIDKLLRQPARSSRTNPQAENGPADVPGSATG